MRSTSQCAPEGSPLPARRGHSRGFREGSDGSSYGLHKTLRKLHAVVDERRAPGADLEALHAGQDRAGVPFGLDKDADDRRQPPQTKAFRPSAITSTSMRRQHQCRLKPL